MSTIKSQTLVRTVDETPDEQVLLDQIQQDADATATDRAAAAVDRFAVETSRQAVEAGAAVVVLDGLTTAAAVTLPADLPGDDPDGTRRLVSSLGAVFQRDDEGEWTLVYQAGPVRVYSRAQLVALAATVGLRVSWSDREYVGVPAAAHDLGDPGYGGLFLPAEGDVSGAAGWWDLVREDQSVVRSEWWAPPRGAATVAAHFGFATAAEVRAAHPWVDRDPYLTRAEWLAWDPTKGAYTDAALLAQRADWLAWHAAMHATPDGGTCVLSGYGEGDRRLTFLDRRVTYVCEAAHFKSFAGALPHSLGASVVPDFDYDALLPDRFGVEPFLGDPPALRCDTATVAAGGRLWLDGGHDPAVLVGRDVLVRVGTIPTDPIESPVVYRTRVEEVEDLGGGRWRTVVGHQGYIPPVHTLTITAAPVALGVDGAGRQIYELTVAPLTGSLKADKRYIKDTEDPLSPYDAVLDFGGGRVVRVLKNDATTNGVYGTSATRVLVAVDVLGGAAPLNGDAATYGDQYWVMPLRSYGCRIEGSLTVEDGDESLAVVRSSAMFSGFDEADLSALSFRSEGFDRCYTDLSSRGNPPASTARRSPRGKVTNDVGLDSQASKNKRFDVIELEDVSGAAVEAEAAEGLTIGELRMTLSGAPTENQALINITPASKEVRLDRVVIEGGGSNPAEGGQSGHALYGVGGPAEGGELPLGPDASSRVLSLYSRVDAVYAMLFDALAYTDPVTSARFEMGDTVRETHDLDLAAGEVVVDLSGAVRSLSIRVTVPGEDGSAPLAAGGVEVVTATGKKSAMRASLRSGQTRALSVYSTDASERSALQTATGLLFCDARLMLFRPVTNQWPAGSTARVTVERLTNSTIEDAVNLVRLDYQATGLVNATGASVNVYALPVGSEALTREGIVVGTGTPAAGFVLPARTAVAAAVVAIDAPGANEDVRLSVLHHDAGTSGALVAALNVAGTVLSSQSRGVAVASVLNTGADVPGGKELVARLTLEPGYSGGADALVSVWAYVHGRGPWVTA
ncbi:MAG: hypothetical protein CMM84_03610 [Rhodothermaceae bacterium]|nr:hypothetical protein [Rhodothermaceae bacterium]MBC15304.1 hypothetical protein [Rhodothermaceae bacterium]